MNTAVGIIDKKNRIKRDYNKSAEFYNLRYKEIQYAKYRTIFSSRWLSSKDINIRILDLGSGTGLLFEFLGGENLDFIGIDISHEMLKLSKEPGKVLGDLENLPFKANSFDLILSFTVLQNLPTLKVLREVRRVLKPKKIFAFTILKKKLPPELSEELTRNNFRMLEKLACGEDEGFVCMKLS